MKNFSKYILAGAVLMSGLAFASCSDDDETVKTALSAVSGSNTADQHSLTFEWQPVDNCRQYGYEFRKKGSIGAPQGGVTAQTKLTFTGLEPATAYELSVWAFADYESDFTTSPVTTMTATTADLINLAAPELSVEMKSSVALVTWPEIEGAGSYSYSYNLAGEVSEGVTTETSLRITNVPMGTHSVTVTAEPADDRYRPSTSTVEFTRTSVVVMSVKGTYTSSQTGTSWESTLEKSDDDTYTLYNWYGVEGYNLEFTVDPATTELRILNAESTDSYGYAYVPTGTSLGSLACYPVDGFSSLTYSKSGGTMTLYVWGAEGGYDYFVWGDGGNGQPGFTTDSLAGTYSVNATGYDYSDAAGEYVESGFTCTVTIEKSGDNEIVMKDFLFAGTALTGTVDPENLTITFEPQTFSYYSFVCPVYDENWNLTTAPVIGRIDEATGNITLESWATEYSGYTYHEYVNTVLVKN